MVKAVYPGSFDPPTLGHLDIIRRASRLFSELVVAVVANPSKSSLFALEERVHMLEKDIGDIPNVSIYQFDGLLVKFMGKMGSFVVVRGLRFVTDFEAEFQMAMMNKKLYSSKLETVFIFTDEKYSYLSSSLVKEVAEKGGKVDEFVSDHVRRSLTRRFKEMNGGQ